MLHVIPMKDPISLRAYAKLRGCSAMAVSVAVRDGRLKASVVRVNDQPKIADVALADLEWERNTDAQRRVNAAGGVDLERERLRVEIAALEAPAAPPPPRADPGPLQPEDNATATQRLKSAQADLAELKFEQEAGDLVSRDEVLREWAGLLSQVRTKIMGAPTALKQALPHLTVADVVVIEDTLRATLEDLVTAESKP